ncbi:MAG TPA: Holliday junction branch migration protein RuvA [bacterium]
MISTLQGILSVKAPTSIVVETSGVGFQLSIPFSTYEALGEVGQSIRILTYLHVREDTLQLYGFATEPERRLFLLLLSVTGIGPKVAQGILSGIPVDAFESAVRKRDIEVLLRVPGVGKKTAERIVLELRDKVKDIQPEAMPLTEEGSSLIEEAVLALVSLGYKRPQAQQAVQSIVQNEPSLTIEGVLRKALQHMSR